MNHSVETWVSGGSFHFRFSVRAVLQLCIHRLRVVLTFVYYVKLTACRCSIYELTVYVI